MRSFEIIRFYSDDGPVRYNFSSKSSDTLIGEDLDVASIRETYGRVFIKRALGLISNDSMSVINQKAEALVALLEEFKVDRKSRLNGNGINNHDKRGAALGGLTLGWLNQFTAEVIEESM